MKTNLTINEQKIRLNQIQDTVYNYPLNLGIGNFLKIPKIKSKDTADKDFVHQALSDFFLRIMILHIPMEQKAKLLFTALLLKNSIKIFYL